MTIIVTGAAGFIGSNLSKKLLESNYKVIGIDNFSFGFKRNIEGLLNHPKFKFVEGDIRNSETLGSLNGDIIVHLASQKIPRYTNALVTLNDNYLMLNNVIENCKNKNLKLVYASTSDVYGKNNAVPFSEESDLVMGKTTVKRWAYALSKIYGEQLIIANNNEFNLEFTIARFFGSYGPNQNLTWWGGPQSVFIGKALINEPIEIHGDGLQSRTFTFIDDTVDGLLKCILDPASKNEIFNVASDPKEETSILNLGNQIWRLINGEGSTPKINFIPYATFGNYEDVKRRVPDISKIKSCLGFHPQYNLLDGLTATINWQKNIQK